MHSYGPFSDFILRKIKILLQYKQNKINSNFLKSTQNWTKVSIYQKYGIKHTIHNTCNNINNNKTPHGHSNKIHTQFSFVTLVLTNHISRSVVNRPMCVLYIADFLSTEGLCRSMK